jgi:hypothetical protein
MRPAVPHTANMFSSTGLEWIPNSGVLETEICNQNEILGEDQINFFIKVIPKW